MVVDFHRSAGDGWLAMVVVLRPQRFKLPEDKLRHLLVRRRVQVAEPVSCVGHMRGGRQYFVRVSMNI